MTDKEIFEKLEAEIERLENYENESVTSSDTKFGWVHGKTFALTSIRVLLDSMQKEPKECMYSKDNFTDEDRKVLCDGCEEECEFNKKEELVNEELYTVAKEYANNITDKIGYRLQLRRAVCFGANWKEQQLMAKAVDATVHLDAGGYPYIPQMELYDYDKDIPLAKEGDKYNVILIKKD